MCIFKEIGKFVKNGASVFNEASKGNYSRQSEAIRSIEKELFSKDDGSFVDDKRNLAKDRENVNRDIRNSYNKLQLHNG